MRILSTLKFAFVSATPKPRTIKAGVFRGIKRWAPHSRPLPGHSSTGAIGSSMSQKKAFAFNGARDGCRVPR
jgi:hypothetical protein